MKKAQGLPITTIIIAALGILVLVVIGAIFGGQIFKFGVAASACPGRCYKAPQNIPVEAPFGMYSEQACNPEFEILLGGTSIPRAMPKVDNPTDWRCDECCILTG